MRRAPSSRGGVIAFCGGRAFAKTPPVLAPVAVGGILSFF